MDFDEKFYTKAYPDTKHQPRHYIKNHYETIGRKYNRIRSEMHFYSLYPDFNADGYYQLNKDLHKLNNEERLVHYHHHGKSEGRKYYKVQPNDKIKKEHKIINKDITNQIKELNNNKKFQYKEDNYFFTLNNSLLNLINDENENSPTYVVLSDWGLPPFGGGECWMIDTMKWMSEIGFKCYYIYFVEYNSNNYFYNVSIKNIEHSISIANETKSFNLTFIEFPYKDKIELLQFIRLLNPVVIAHQGLSRLEYMKIANILNYPFVTGFCFWQDIIEMENRVPININMLNSKLPPSSNFKTIKENSSAMYVCGEFVNDIILKLHNYELPVIHTITDDNHFKLSEVKLDMCKYVTIININKLKGGLLVQQIIKMTKEDIPFYIIDSQFGDCNESVIIRKLIACRPGSVYVNSHVDNLKELYSKTRILLIPSLVDETFCRVAYEGMTNSIPILSTNNGNLKYLLNDYADFLQADPELWAKKINKIYYDIKYLNTMSSRKKIKFNSKEKYISMITNIKPIINTYNNIGILCPWGDQGLGIQCREYYNLLNKLGANVSVYSFSPYNTLNGIKLLQTDPKEWDNSNYPNIYYSSFKREEITIDDFLNYIYKYKINKFIIVETCFDKVFELARVCRVLNIKVYCIPNLEIIRSNELEQYNVFDRILVNNNITYNILTKLNKNYNLEENINNDGNKNIHILGFYMLNEMFVYKENLYIKPNESRTLRFFCCGGLNSITRKNINKIYDAFFELKNENSSINIKLNIYIQGIQVPKGLKNTDNINIEIGSRTYKEISNLYKKNDIFIHLGGHEGLGIGLFEAISSNVPVLTIDNSPNNELITNNVNGWLIPCTYEDMDDNPYGLIKKAVIQKSDIKNCIKFIISNEKIYSNITSLSKKYNYINNTIKYIIN